MCGICGIVNFSGLRIQERTIKKMTKTLNHRGPDDCGVYINDYIGLGHTRLSIIDLSKNGHQPMTSECGRFTITFNGEIYNFIEIRNELEKTGVKFRSKSDTEVVLCAYIQWGIKSITRLNGMFAFAIWDSLTNKLFLFRDKFGIKPLYYNINNNGIVFGSEVKAILASGEISRQVNYASLHEYLYYGAALGSNSFFDGIFKVLPGCFLSVSKNKNTYQSFEVIPEVDHKSTSLEEVVTTVQQKLELSVKNHLISDVPVGIFLSGGIDSSTITALATRHYQGKLRTYSVGFDFENGINELPKARNVAKHFCTDHNELYIIGNDMPNVIENLVLCHDEPFGDAANIPLYLLCKELKGSVKVILQGDGGDEIFAGYRRYNVLSFEKLWRVMTLLGGFVNSALPRSPASYRYLRFCHAMKHSDPAMRMALLLTEESLADPPTQILTKEIQKIINRYDPFLRYREIVSRYKNLDPVQVMLYTDCQIVLPDIFLEKVDKSTMAHGIEVRVPFLDKELSSYVMGLPSHMKVRFGQKKWLLRKAMRGILPDYILDGKKTGFSVPYAWWLKGPMADYMKSVLLDAETFKLGLFDRAKLELCINDHINNKRNYGSLLYKLLNLSLWYKYYIIGR